MRSMRIRIRKPELPGYRVLHWFRKLLKEKTRISWTVRCMESLFLDLLNATKGRIRSHDFYLLKNSFLLAVYARIFHHGHMLLIHMCAT
jgi:hypothetical protein